MRELVIPQSLLDEAVMHARQMRPDEACGLLLGDGRVVKAVKAMTNANPSPVSYSLEPGEQLKAMKEAEAGGLSLMGIYHSHPSSPAMPSLTDIERAFFPGTREPNFPGAAYVIIGLMTDVPDVKAYLIEKDEVRRVEIHVVHG
jgi:proteasome lid subunit RPN8/RPN11